MTMAVGAKAGEESLEDLLGFLERQRSEKLAEEADPRPQKGPRIPKLKDRWRPQWSPPLDKRNLTKESGEEVQPAWLRVCRSAGEAFHANPGYLKPKQLEPRVTERLTMPDRSFAHLPSQIKFSHDEPLPAPTDALCGEMHRRWLQKHGKARDRHLHEVYYALNRVDKAQEILDADARRMEIARDMISQGPIDRPHLSKAARSGIKKLKTAVKSIHQLRNAAAEGAMAAGDLERAKRFNPLKMQEEKNKARLIACRSDPCLRTKQPTPRGQLKHVENFAGPERSLKHFRSSTPWREEDAAQELGLRPWGGTGPRRHVN
ncbi:unnamed protein product [Effrenium voratum]|nr:unnamed protein product [Effrenium voratum]|mmetsp:Transcript_88644/g.211656  ORF Transcript_88644/g.211656 Transcript_88644/m.211656 type:complete len:318 (-) Transcript_88644:123-1076(-)|eukprot:CAMPEP_0181448608 /NCGR_PEP_ID=MMETSP1110-20121109/27226_1 /TAXON_ID=174948 /ORGANISM="Symbiodinium sp., Strain CCMP421" /LENGTH=317 /DNA_ID=CAMNT_0023572759 /DNA_START=30 /DNA_END=983 /DNA_ORIENTATION=+